MGNVNAGYKNHKIQIGMHINEKRLSCTPSHVWWIYLLVVSEFSCSATMKFKCIKGHHITISMHQTHLMTMKTYLLHAVGRCGLLLDLEAKALDDSEWVLSKCHRFLASISGANQLSMNLG